MLLRSLLATCGAALRRRFCAEQLLVQQLDSCADIVKNTKESQRLNTLLRELEPIHTSLVSNPTSLPIGPSLQVRGLEVRSCSYFPSNTLPLKLSFHSAELEGIFTPFLYFCICFKFNFLNLNVFKLMNVRW